MGGQEYFEKLYGELLSDSSYSDQTGYEPINPQIRDPEDSELDWDFHSEPRNKRLLKRYPPKLLDRAAEMAVSDKQLYVEETVDGKYIEVSSEHNRCHLIIENNFSAAGVQAYKLEDEIFFTEHLADERNDLDFSGTPERAASTNVPETQSFEDFLEGLETESDSLVIR